MSAPRSSRKLPKAAVPHRGGALARGEAMRLLVEGWQLASVARQLGVSRMTVREWRDSPKGALLIAAARRDREAVFARAADESRRILREGGPRAAQRLVDLIDSPTHGRKASEAVLNRIGVPSVERVETPADDFDLTGATEADLTAFEALRQKYQRKDG